MDAKTRSHGEDDGGNNLDQRRRRALYRASYRGTKEMDWLLGKYAVARLSAMRADDLAAFEELLMLPDDQLQSMILGKVSLNLASELIPHIHALREFHGISV